MNPAAWTAAQVAHDNVAPPDDIDTSTSLQDLGDGQALVGYTAAGLTVTIEGAWIGQVYVDATDFACSVVAGWQKAIRAEIERDIADYEAAQRDDCGVVL